MNTHEKFMKKAIALALKGAGKTFPNPAVGALVVKNNKIIGRGYHKIAGDFHAEINAMNNAGKNVHNSDLYITLEPCAHFGKTPPCVDAIIKNKVKNVFIGSKDSNPVVNGRGISKLKKAGVNVVSGILEEECKKINEGYFFRHEHGRPMFIAKSALSWDGKISAMDGSSKWISSELARKEGHLLRARADLIMVGAETIRTDNPRLTVRFDKEEFRRVAVISRKLNLSLSCNLFPRPADSLFIFTTKDAPVNKVRAWEDLGAKVYQTSGDSGEVDWKKIISYLNSINCNQVLVEGGGRLISSLMNSGFLDKMVLFVAPILLGGNGKDFLPNLKISNIKFAVRFENINIGVVDNELRLEGKPCLQD